MCFQILKKYCLQHFDKKSVSECLEAVGTSVYCCRFPSLNMDVRKLLGGRY